MTNHHNTYAGMRVSRLSAEQAKKLHAASLTILERTGARLYEPEAIELVKKAGADVSDGNRVRVPARLVEWALSIAPKEVAIYDRAGQPALAVGGHRYFCGPGSDCLNIIDHRTNQRRRPVLQDVVEGITLCDALENISFVMSMFLPTDVNQSIADRYQMEVMLNHTTKPIVFVTYDMSGCADAIEMVEAVAGGPAALQAKPFVTCYINVTTGLRHNEEALQKLLFLAGKGLPAIYIPVTSAGTTGPVTMAGTLALNNAGVLTGLVLSQLKREGAPVIVPGWGGEGIDMRTMVDPYCGADQRGLAEALAHRYNLPMFSLAGCADAKLVDQQAGIEAALTLMVDILAGGNIIHDLGYLESGLSGSLAQLAICDEIVEWIRRSSEEIEISDETLALDLIDEAGPDGEFLSSEHTLAHFRDRWYPRLFERYDYSNWLADGGKTMAERAAGRVSEILSTHKPAPLSPAAARAVRAVVERAETQYRE
ncbi:MAG TPA: trimethylamine methyltransferase family protein [Anaerolineales bacterium]|nr:trimethylamine methyltransferase family protein [Anaerolineales bacterium]